MEIIKEFYRKDKKVNPHYLNRYLKILSSLGGCECVQIENHHILPRSIFPEFSEVKENTIPLPTKWHYLVHWILFKIFSKERYKQQMIFAFNQMKRIIPSDEKNGLLYELSRKYVSEAISKSNKGRKKTEEEKLSISKRTSGTVIVKNTEGNCFRVPKDDPRYISGEFVFYRTGHKHPEETIQKMKENSGITGKIMCFNEDGEIKYFFEEEIPEGFSKEMPKSHREKLSLSKRGLMWYNNDIENIRVKEGNQIPDGFKRGKLKTKGFVGWELVNSKRRKTNVID